MVCISIYFQALLCLNRSYLTMFSMVMSMFSQENQKTHILVRVLCIPYSCTKMYIWQFLLVRQEHEELC